MMEIEHNDNGRYPIHYPHPNKPWNDSERYTTTFPREIQDDYLDTAAQESKIMSCEEWYKYMNSKEHLFEDRAYQIVDELVKLLVTKQSDYGSHNIAGAPGGAMNGLLVRMHDKLARIVNLTKKDIAPNFESIEDSFKDLANYCVISIMVLYGWWEGANFPEVKK